MKRKNKIMLAVGMFIAFVFWTILVQTVDVRPIGPEGTSIGFSTFNSRIHKLLGVHMCLYTITDWLGLVPVAFVFGFGMFGLAQWIKRKHILHVDRTILGMGIVYILTMAGYLLFEEVVINYRPVLIGGYLEASYPSSTTLLVLSVMPTAALELSGRMQNKKGRAWIVGLILVFSACMVLGRLLSGVHWCSDIVGAFLLSAGLVSFYWCFSK